MRVLGTPEVYLTFKPDLLTETGAVANESTAKFLTGFLNAFAHWLAPGGA